MRKIAIYFCATLLGCGGALCHGDEAHGVGPSWTFDPWIVCPLAALAVLYLLGTCKLWRAGRGTGFSGPLLLVAGWLSLAGALLSPLHWLGEHLFTFHMIEHEIVMAVSAPLLVLARPIGRLLWAFPRLARLKIGRLMGARSMRTIWAWLSGGRNATILHGIAIWVWHAPIAIDATLANVAMHRLQHLSFLATAIVFWWSVLRNSDRGLAAWHLFITMLHMSVLGALIALAPRVVYVAQTAAARDWGLTPLEDQQLAGIFMWIPAGTVYAGAALIMFTLWIAKSGAESSNAEGKRRGVVGAA
jgi:cytochrome c oxidase assembly factor CtaG